MEIIAGGRGSGKTHRLAEWVKAGRCVGKRRVIVTVTQAEARRIAKDHNLSLANVCRWEDIQRNIRGSGEVEIAFDNLDLILQSIAGPTAAVKFITLGAMHNPVSPSPIGGTS